MKMKIFPKVFLYSFSMMALITLVAHALIFFIAPTQDVLITNMLFTNAQTAYSEIDMQQLITRTIVKSFPLSLLCCLVISFAFSFLFSRRITSPILSIEKTVEKMAELNTTAKIEIKSADEIGQLASNINALYGSLLSTIQNLEEEKENVSKAEKEKADFLRMASHELKTPVTELNATLENMILGVGEYQRFDIYLPKCKAITEDLGKMIKDILSTSRLQIDTNTECARDFSLRELVLKQCESFRLIAETKGIDFEVQVNNDCILHLPEKLFNKAISNILLNAVNYTTAGNRIVVKISERELLIYNKCTPIPNEHLKHIFEPFYRPDYSRNQDTGGNGFGLYIVETILKRLDLSYSFTPSALNDGMDFIITF